MTATMAETRRGHAVWMGTVARAIWPWCLLFIIGKPLLELRHPPYEWPASFLRWAWAVTEDAALVLPFLIFAGGVALVRVLRPSRRLVRTAVIVGISAGAVSYALGAWVAPQVQSRFLAALDPESADLRRFQPRTPTGILENLRFVEANPPEEYTLSVGAPQRFPPNVLRWELHGPPAMAVFAVVNVLLGVLAATLTLDLSRRAQRNARLAIGVFGGIAFFACLAAASPVGPFLRDGTMRSGVISAWAPFVFPIAQAFVLVYLVRRRERHRPETRAAESSGRSPM